MKKLSQLKVNQTAVITKIICNDELKQRFYSFGIIKGANITIEEVSLTKNTIALVVDDTSVALRLKEAKNIEVELIETN